MDTTCRIIEDKILGETPLSHAEHIHVLHCTSCQDFAAVHQILLSQNIPDERLDNRTLDAMKAALKSGRPAAQRLRLFRYIGTAAALLIALFLVTQRQLHRQRGEQRKAPGLQEGVLMFYEDASDNLDAIEYEVASVISLSSSRSMEP